MLLGLIQLQEDRRCSLPVWACHEVEARAHPCARQIGKQAEVRSDLSGQRAFPNCRNPIPRRRRD